MDYMLIQRFNLRRPLIFEDIAHGQEVIAHSDRPYIIIRSDAESLAHDLPEMLATAKLAEIDPLLVTFISQAHPTPDELHYLGMFNALCSPLRDAWIWGIMRRIVSDIYEREFADLYSQWEKLHDSMFLRDGGVRIDDPDIRRQMIGMWAIVSENPENNVDIKFSGPAENISSWERYIVVMREFIRQDPDPEIYPLIALAADAPYTVSIKDDGLRHYDIRKKEAE